MAPSRREMPRTVKVVVTGPFRRPDPRRRTPGPRRPGCAPGPGPRGAQRPEAGAPGQQGGHPGDHRALGGDHRAGAALSVGSGRIYFRTRTASARVGDGRAGRRLEVGRRDRMGGVRASPQSALRARAAAVPALRPRLGDFADLVLGELLNQQIVDRGEHRSCVELIVGQITWQQRGPVGGLARGSDGVTHDHQRTPFSFGQPPATKATTTSPHSASRRPTTDTSVTSGCCSRHISVM